MGMKMQFSPDFPQLYADAVRRLDKLDRQFFYQDRKMAMDRKRRAYDDEVLNRTGEFDNFDEMPYSRGESYEWRRGSMNGPVTDESEGYSYGAGRSPLHDFDPVSQGSENYDPPEEFEEAEDDEEEDDRRAAERQERERPQRIGQYKSNSRNPERMSHGNVRSYTPGNELSRYQARKSTGEDRRRHRRGMDEPPYFQGRPRPGGTMDRRARHAMDAAIRRPDSLSAVMRYAASIPWTPSFTDEERARSGKPWDGFVRTRKEQLAMDSATRVPRGGFSTRRSENFYDMFPDARRIKIG
jgi:hypothetical protein